MLHPEDARGNVSRNRSHTRVWSAFWVRGNSVHVMLCKRPTKFWIAHQHLNLEPITPRPQWSKYICWCPSSAAISGCGGCGRGKSIRSKYSTSGLVKSEHRHPTTDSAETDVTSNHRYDLTHNNTLSTDCSIHTSTLSQQGFCSLNILNFFPSCVPPAYFIADWRLGVKTHLNLLRILTLLQLYFPSNPTKTRWHSTCSLTNHGRRVQTWVNRRIIFFRFIFV